MTSGGYHTILLRENELSGRRTVKQMIYDLHKRIEEPPDCEVSFHGEHEDVFCVTWSAEEVSLEALRSIADYFSWRFRDVELYAEVSERPYRTQPELPDLGRLTGTFNDGLKRGFLPPEPEPLPLPAAVSRVLAQLRDLDKIHGQPLVKRFVEGDQQIAEITVRVPISIDPKYDRHDDLYEAIEGTGTPELMVIAKLDLYDPFPQWRKGKDEAG